MWQGLSAAFLCALALWLTPSCGDNRTLTPRAAKKALEKETAFRDSSQVAKLDVGFYETDSAGRLKLEELQKAGVVRCKASVVSEHRRVERYTWWEGTTVAYEDVKHIFVDVALSDEGRKYVVANPPEHPVGDDNLPSTDYHNISDTVAAVVEGVGAASPAAKSSADDKNKAYTDALKRVKYSAVNVLTGFYRVERVVNVFCPENYRKGGMGKCEFVCVFTGITPFGRSLTSLRDDERTYGSATFTRFEDRGWRVDIYDINGSATPADVPTEAY